LRGAPTKRIAGETPPTEHQEVGRGRRREGEGYCWRRPSAVWLVLPAERELLVLDAAGERRLHAGQRVPSHPDLPGLEPNVSDLFEQLGRG